MTVYGLDIGGTKMETAIFDDDLKLVKSWRVKTPTDNYSDFLRVAQQQIHIADQFTGSNCKVGIGMPGLINSQGKVLSANVPCATNKLVLRDLNELLKRPVRLKNDTRCFALSEANDGAGKGYSRVFGAIIGTGAAGGMCIDGKLEDTYMGIAGEYGHIPLSASTQQKYNLPILKCGCGLIGCVESYIAGPGIANLYSHFEGKSRSAKYFNQQLNEGDELASDVLSCYLDILGETFAALVKFIEPDIIVLGGGVTQINEIVEFLPIAIEKYLFSGFHSPKIVAAKYGASSGVRGAAILSNK